MDAKYFQLMYQNVENGVIHTISVADTENEGKWNGCYLCGVNGNNDPINMDEKFQTFTEAINLLVVADAKDNTVEAAIKLVKANEIRKVILPDEGKAGSGLKERFLAEGAGEVIGLKTGEIYKEMSAQWNIKLAAFGKGADAAVVMFSDAPDISPEEKDCLLTVKPSYEARSFQVCIDGKDHSDSMRGCFNNDFAVCKGHNGKDSKGYITGTLLLGNVDLKRCGLALKEVFSEECANRLRFMSFADSGCDDSWDTNILNWMDTDNENINQYFIIPKSESDAYSKAICQILKRGPRNNPILTSDKYGMCVSGFFTKR